MSLYSYRAVNQHGEVIKGKLTAQSEMELETKLKQSGLDIVDSKVVNENSILSAFSGVTLKELILVCIHLHHLEEAGVPLLDSISDLRDTSENPKLRQVLMDLYDSLKNGSTLSLALSKHPAVFDPIFVGLVKAGERTGNFAEIFAHLEQHYKWVGLLRAKIKKATYYPVFLMFLMIAVVAMMMVFVVPKLTVFLKSQNIALPAYTTALINLSDFMASYWEFIVFTPIILFVAIKIACKSSKKASFYRDKVLLFLPAVGNVIRKIEIARFCHFFAITYKSGIGILECLQASEDVVNNLVIKQAIMDIRDDVGKGTNLTQAITNTKEFPSLVTRMFKVGEDSGNLDRSLENINHFYDEEINTAVDALVGVIQPMLTFVMGGMLMWITLAVFGPIYGSFGNVGKGR
ncbi:MAG: type II secretion system F family protein, partial [Rickettsiales bacterium]